jgi:plastocyanin
VPFTLILDNRDNGVPHNIAVKGQDGTVIAKSEVVAGPTRAGLVVPPLVAGTYPFSCEVHPNMTGTITVTP